MELRKERNAPHYHVEERETRKYYGEEEEEMEKNFIHWLEISIISIQDVFQSKESWKSWMFFIQNVSLLSYFCFLV